MAQDLLPVGDEEDALRAEANGVECGEPGLSKSGGEHDKARGVAFGAGLLEGFEGAAKTTRTAPTNPKLGLLLSLQQNS